MSQVVFLWCNGTTWFVDWVGLGLPGGPQVDIVPPGEFLSVAGLNGRTATTNGVNTDAFTALLDPNIFYARRVPYPAAAFPPGSSLTSGVNKMTDAINAIPNGIKFALGGYSQGAVVAATCASRGLFPGTSGALSHKQGDFLGGVTFGNPIRPVNHIGGGGAFGSYTGQWHNTMTTGGGGCFPASGPFPRLSSAPDTWLDMAALGDPVTTNGTTGPGADMNTLLGTFLGALDVGQWVAAVLGSGALLTSFWKFIETMVKSVPLWDANGKGFQGVGHGSYPYAKPNGIDLTYYQCGLQHLYNLAAPYIDSPTLMPSSPTGGSSTTAGWTTALTA